MPQTYYRDHNNLSRAFQNRIKVMEGSPMFARRRRRRNILLSR
jgi:hypothetical protein